MEFRHLDYFPLVNSRAHKLGDTESVGILNREFKATYDAFLTKMIEKHALTFEDSLAFVYYFLLQDRITEAIELFGTVNTKDIAPDGPLRMQFDYMRAYLDFYTGY